MRKISQDRIDRIFELAKSVPMMTADEIGAATGCSPITVRNYLKGRRKRSDTMPEKLAKIREMYLKGAAISAIIGRHRTSLATVYKAIEGLPPRKRRKRLSDQEREQMRRMYIGGEKIAVIAETFGVIDQTVLANTIGLPRRDIRKNRMTMNMGRSIIVELNDEKPFIVQPTGRMEFCSSSLSPDKQWHFEVVDARDGKIKHIPVAEVSLWSAPVSVDFDRSTDTSRHQTVGE